MLFSKEENFSFLDILLNFYLIIAFRSYIGFKEKLYYLGSFFKSVLCNLKEISGYPMVNLKEAPLRSSFNFFNFKKKEISMKKMFNFVKTATVYRKMLIKRNSSS